MAKNEFCKLNTSVQLDGKEYLKGADVPLGDGKGKLPVSEKTRLDASFGRWVDGKSAPVSAPTPKAGDAEEVAALTEIVSEAKAKIAEQKAALDDLKNQIKEIKEKDAKIAELTESNAELSALLEEATAGDDADPSADGDDGAGAGNQE